MKILVDAIRPNPEQPRRDFDLEALRVLAESIRERGLLQPILVEELGQGTYQIIAGERRWRAHQLLEWPEIEAQVISSNGRGASERGIMAMSENLVRKDLNPVEEGIGIKKLLDEGWSVNDIGAKIGMTSSSVRLRMAILEFEPEIQDLYTKSRIPLGYEVMIALQKLEPEQRLVIARSAKKQQLSGVTIKSLCTRLQRYQSVSVRKRDEGGKFTGENQEHWSAIRQQECVLYDDASKSTCSECPIVVFLWNLSKEAKS